MWGRVNRLIDASATSLLPRYTPMTLREDAQLCPLQDLQHDLNASRNVAHFVED